MADIIPYILAIMIVYDFSLHVFDLLINQKIITMKHPFGMYLFLDAVAGNDKEKRRHWYNIFWTIYWGIASFLIILYLCLI